MRAGARGLARRRVAGGPPGTTRRYASRVVRDMPLYAPPLTARNEMKYVDIELATYTADTTGNVTFMTPISPGSLLVGQREGSRVMLCGAQIRGTLTANTGPLAQATMLLVYDKQSTNAAPAILDVLEQVSSYSYQNTANRSRFDILGRWNYAVVGTAAAPTSGNELRQLDIKTTFRKTQIWGEGGGATVAQVISGGLFLLTFGDQAAGPTAALFDLHLRVFYGDN